MKKFLTALLFSLTLLIGGEISVSISEDLVNEYLNLIGNYQIVTGKKDNQATWTIKNPRVKFQYGKAVFLTTILFKKGKTDIKKDIKRNIDVEYNSNKNTLKLVIMDSLIKMERRGNVLGKIDQILVRIMLYMFLAKFFLQLSVSIHLIPLFLSKASWFPRQFQSLGHAI